MNPDLAVVPCSKRRFSIACCLPLLMMFFMHAVFAADFSGSYVEESEQSLILNLQETDGVITGTMTQFDESMQITARRQGDGFSGSLGSGDERMSLTGTMNNTMLMLTIDAYGEFEQLVFRRSGNVAGIDKETPAGQRNVIINGVKLSDAELAQVEQTYQIHIPDADYWYDRVLGDWGGRGGPTMGFVLPGLNLGGPLQADASGGGTYVVVNGRVLHPYDLMVLQQITGPIIPGRYFLTAQGYAGYEGGPVLWNLATLAAGSQGGGGGSNTWQSRLGSGFSDGETSAVFLPNGGIVSTGN